MATPYIVIGCPTTGGGKVLTGSSFFLIDGIPIACVGDTATCPKHQTVSTIISGDPNMQVMGKMAARVNDSLSCGCKLLPKQYLVVGDNGGGSGSNASNSAQSSFVQQKEIPVFDEQTVADFLYAEGMPYFIETEAGQTFKGIVPADGKLPRVATEGAYALYLGDDAIEKSNGAA